MMGESQPLVLDPVVQSFCDADSPREDHFWIGFLNLFWKSSDFIYPDTLAGDNKFHIEPRVMNIPCDYFLAFSNLGSYCSQHKALKGVVCSFANSAAKAKMPATNPPVKCLGSNNVPVPKASRPRADVAQKSTSTFGLAENSEASLLALKTAAVASKMVDVQEKPKEHSEVGSTPIVGGRAKKRSISSSESTMLKKLKKANERPSATGILKVSSAATQSSAAQSSAAQSFAEGAAVLLPDGAAVLLPAEQLPIITVIT